MSIRSETLYVLHKQLENPKKRSLHITIFTFSQQCHTMSPRTHVKSLRILRSHTHTHTHTHTHARVLYLCIYLFAPVCECMQACLCCQVSRSNNVVSRQSSHRNMCACARNSCLSGMSSNLGRKLFNFWKNKLLVLLFGLFSLICLFNRLFGPFPH